MSIRILIVEDEPAILEGLKEFFEAEGHEVIGTSNGKEAYASLETASKNPSVILFDLMMPEVNGFEFRRMQMNDNRFKSIPAIAMSADKRALDLLVSQDKGIQSVNKPIRPDDLLQKITEAASAAPVA